MSYTVYRPFAYLKRIHTNILEYLFVIIFSGLYYILPASTIIIINEFYKIVTLF